MSLMQLNLKFPLSWSSGCQSVETNIYSLGEWWHHHHVCFVNKSASVEKKFFFFDILVYLTTLNIDIFATFHSGCLKIKTCDFSACCLPWEVNPGLLHDSPTPSQMSYLLYLSLFCIILCKVFSNVWFNELLAELSSSCVSYWWGHIAPWWAECGTAQLFMRVGSLLKPSCVKPNNEKRNSVPSTEIEWKQSEGHPIIKTSLETSADWPLLSAGSPQWETPFPW